MFVIPVRVCGDAWSNRSEVQNLLYQTPKETSICLDFLSEGASMEAIGLTEILDQHCKNTHRDPGTITVINNPNTLEQTVYKNITPGPSHFFSLAKQYWCEVAEPSIEAKTFAFFVGRKTIARGWMLYDLYHSFGEKFVFSSMHDRNVFPWRSAPIGTNLESVADWIPSEEFEKFSVWFDNCPISSLDGKSVRNQFELGYNTNLDLLQHYDKFHIELVSETYTMGDTFFPTEKTVRPIMARRPMLVYGPRYFLRRLKDLGFETYDSCWDESYDTLEGPARWQAMRNLIPRISINGLAQEIAIRNKQHLKRMIYDHKNI